MEHIKNIEIQNFKSIRHCKIDGCKRINVFVGPPNVGKSNILEGMGLCSLIEGNSRSQYLEDYIRFEKSSSLFYKKYIDNGFGVFFNDQDYGIAGFLEIDSSIDGFKLCHFNEKNETVRFHSSLATYTLKFNIDKELKFKVYENVDSQKKGIKSMSSSWTFDNKNNNTIEYLKTGNIKKYIFNESIDLIDYNSKELQIPFGENIGTFLAYQNGKLFNAIQNLVVPNSFEIESNGNIRYKKKLEDGFSVSFSYNEIADTLRRLVFHLTAIMSNKDSVLLFEEPEAQMYPPYINKLTSEIIYDENKNQYFIATHSPFVLNDFLENAKEEVQIYIVDNKNGETIVQKMTEEEMHEAYQYGSAFFMNIPNFIKD